jgi:cellulose synthase/poly-beta-1,6-N-acetylglucosamine synthase-like glycosyltransferase/4-amino-4-deoxy-L-arabinose transferase-like glycosyltransferase
MSAVGTVIQFSALLFGAVWIWVNVYQFYPVLSHLIGSLARASGEDEKQYEREPIPAETNGGGSESDEVVKTDGGQVDALQYPSIDIFIPAYEEGEVIEQAISSVRECRYPHDLLNVVVLLEPDDTDTRTTLRRLEDQYDFERLTVPAMYPGEPNKPRALNYAYERTTGEIVGVLDAEDIIAQDLCQRVSVELTSGYDFAQSRLDMVNEDDGWLNTMFRAEYGYWYETSISGFSNRDYPIPMAGTTCFFRRAVLDDISEKRIQKFGDPWDDEEWEWINDHGLDGLVPWDPNNVTEDFELGMFLWQEEYQFAYIDSVTKGESPLTLDSWIKQRTRWQKGKVYTFKQLISSPPKGLFSKLHMYTQSAVPHIGAVNFSAMILVLLGANLFRSYTPSSSTLTVLNISLVFGLIMMGLYSYGYWTASSRPYPTRIRRAVVVFCSLPIYWLLQWVADLRALQQVYSGRLHWSKTTHIGRNNGDSIVADGSISRTRDLKLSRGVRWIGLALVILAGAGLRLYNLTERSLYGDELYSIVRASLSLPELLTVPLSLDSHPPLYYIFLHYWMEIFGSTTFAVRSLTVVFASTTLVGLYLLGTELYDDRAGLIAALLYAISTFYIHFGRVARMYSLLTLLTVLSWYSFVRLKQERTRDNAFYILLSGLLVYTHVYALFVVLAQNAYVALSETRNGISLRRWTALQAILGAISSPWLLLLLGRVFNLSGQNAGLVNWIPKPDGFRSVIRSLSRFVGYPVHYPFLQGTSDAPLVGTVDPWGLSWILAALLVSVFVICAILAVVRFKTDGGYELTDLQQSSQLSLLFLSPILVPFVISYVIAPIYWTRYTIPASIGFVLLVANGITNIDSDMLRRGILGFTVVSSLFFVGVYYSQSSVEDWQGSAACLNEGVEDDDLAVYQPAWIQPRLGYYNMDGFAKETLPPSHSMTEQKLATLQQYTANHDEIWLLRYHPGGSPQTDDQVFATLNASYKNVTSAHDGAFSVYRFGDGTGEPDESGSLSSMCPSSEVHIW